MIGATALTAVAARDGNVTIGIRPEDIVANTDGPLSLTIDLVEELGAHRLLHGRLMDQAISVHVGKDSVLQAGQLQVSFKPNALALFDPKSGARL